MPAKIKVYRPRDLLKEITDQLRPFSREASIEAEIILEALFNLKWSGIILNKPLRLNQKTLKKIGRIITGRQKHAPLQYLLANINFMGLTLKVTPAVLIPRQETEILAEKCLGFLKDKKGPILGLDLGTGSGNLAIVLTKFNKIVRMVAVDFSQEALKVACGNAVKGRVGARIRFLKSDLFKGLRRFKGKFDFIISNPPYVSARQMKNLRPEVKFEPRMALQGGHDGLEIIKKIVHNADDYLRPDGFLIFEIGALQRKKVAQLIERAGAFKKSIFFKDYSGWDRVVFCEK